jgi:hypothetical protein
MQKIKLNRDNIKILVCCHKKTELPPDDDGIFLPVQVGAALNQTDLGFQRDDMAEGKPCDNISAKNASFCELTAMYWAWKNIRKIYPDLEYIGLNHYRRYFSFDERKFFDDALNKKTDEVTGYRLNKAKLEKILEKHDCIITSPCRLGVSLEMEYSFDHCSFDSRTMKKIVHEKFPEYDEAMYDFYSHSNRFSPCNMTIMKWDDFDAYCSWLFEILFEAEKRIDISNYSTNQKRIFGFMAERLFNVYAKRNFRRMKFLPFVMYDDKFAAEKPSFIRRTFVYRIYALLKTELTFFLLRGFKKYSPELYLRQNGFFKER